MSGEADETYDLIIVGGAMAGATLACSLAGTGLRIAVVDAAAPADAPQPLSPYEFDARVSAITPASREIFREVGIWSSICERRVSPYTAMHVWDADGTGAIDFDAGDVHADALGHIVENRVIIECLQQRLAEQEEVSLLAPASVTALQVLPPRPDSRGEWVSPGMSLSLADGRCLHARWVVGADGARSRIREMAGFATREWHYDHQAIVTTVHTEYPHEQVARQRFMDEGVLAFLPLQTPPGEGEQRYCSIVWSLQPQRAAELMQADDDGFAAALEQAFESRPGRISVAGKRHSFPLRQCHAREYVRDRVVLIGDAAHSIHPLAGQGANLGLMDARVLGEEIRRACREDRDWHEPAVMRRYQRRRMGPNLAMMAVMEGFRHLFADQPPPVRWLRNTGLSTVNSLPAVKNRLLREAMGMSP